MTPLQGVTAIAALADGKRIVTGGGDGLVRLWRIGTESQTLIDGMKEHKVPTRLHRACTSADVSRLR